MRRVLPLLIFACAADTPQLLLPQVVRECSGLVVSPRDPSVWWTHGDSGTGPFLHAVRDDGRSIQTFRVQGFPTRDWEDLTLAPDGALWLADTGDNENHRHNLAVYRLPEPTLPGPKQVRVDRRVGFTYPERGARPDPAALDYDAEAIFFDGETLYLLTKQRTHIGTTLYRFPNLTEREVELEKVSFRALDGSATGARVTSAAMHPKGHTLAVLTYEAVLLFPRPQQGDDWLAADPYVVLLRPSEMGQTEAVAWSGDDLILTNEARRVFHLPAPASRTTPFPGVP